MGWARTTPGLLLCLITSPDRFSLYRHQTAAKTVWLSKTFCINLNTKRHRDRLALSTLLQFFGTDRVPGGEDSPRMLGCKNLAAIGLPPHAVIFVKYREVSTSTILPNFIDLFAETALYLSFGGHKGGVVRGEKRKRTSSI
jgi:hypothetical protein